MLWILPVAIKELAYLLPMPKDFIIPLVFLSSVKEVNAPDNITNSHYNVLILMATFIPKFSRLLENWKTTMQTKTFHLFHGTHLLSLKPKWRRHTPNIRICDIGSHEQWSCLKFLCVVNSPIYIVIQKNLKILKKAWKYVALYFLFDSSYSWPPCSSQNSPSS